MTEKLQVDLQRRVKEGQNEILMKTSELADLMNTLEEAGNHRMNRDNEVVLMEQKTKDTVHDHLVVCEHPSLIFLFSAATYVWGVGHVYTKHICSSVLFFSHEPTDSSCRGSEQEAQVWKRGQRKKKLTAVEKRFARDRGGFGSSC